MKNHSHQGCVHCACHNPLWDHFKDVLFQPDFINKLSDGMETISNAFDHYFSPKKSFTRIYTGGNIRPLIDGDTSTVDAIGFAEGKVVASGKLSEVKAAMDANNYDYGEPIELEDQQCLLPGLIEAHVHIVPSALLMDWNYFGPFNGQVLKEDYSPESLQKDILNAIPQKEGDWILGTEVDPSLMPFTIGTGTDGLNQLQSFSCQTLDSFMGKQKDIPLFMMSASLHSAYVNSSAVELIFTANPALHDRFDTWQDLRTYVDSQGGLQEIDEMKWGFKAIPTHQIQSMALHAFKHLGEEFTTAAERGVTMMYDAGMTDNLRLLLDSYLLTHEHKQRIGYAKVCLTVDDTKALKKHSKLREFHNMYQGNVKLVSDGSNQGLTGYQTKAYCCEPENNKGLFNFPANSHPDNVTVMYHDMVYNTIEKGWPMMIHANGDKAIDLALDVYEQCLDGKSGLDKRHRIEHASLLDAAKIQRMKKLGISPSFLIGHVGYWGYTFSQAIFEGKAEQLDLCQSALDAGLRISFHSDYSVSPLGPLRMMEQSITRVMEQDPEKNILNEKECVSPEAALLAVTRDAAWQCHADDWVGSLKDEHFADFVILEKDPLAAENIDNMRDINVLLTCVGGRETHNSIKKQAAVS